MNAISAIAIDTIEPAFKLVDPASLVLNPGNERTAADYALDNPENVALRQSLAAEGIKNPLRIYDDGVVDDGNRRLVNVLALIKAGHAALSSIPAIVVPRPANETEAVIHRLNLNEARQFSPLAQARAFAKLRDAGMNNSQIAARTPFTSMHIGNMLTLHDASDTIRDAVAEGRLSATLAVETIRANGEAALVKAMEIAAEQGKTKATQRHVDAALDNDGTTPVETGSMTDIADAIRNIGSSQPVEVEAEAVTPVDLSDVPFDLDDTAPAAPTIVEEEEVTVDVTATTPAATATAVADAPASTTAALSLKALLALIVPVAQNLSDSLTDGTNAERLEALEDARADLTLFLAQAKKAGLVD